MNKDVQWAERYGKDLDEKADCVFGYWLQRTSDEDICRDEFRGLIRKYGMKAVIYAIEDTIFEQSAFEADGYYAGTFWFFIKKIDEA